MQNIKALRPAAVIALISATVILLWLPTFSVGAACNGDLSGRLSPSQEQQCAGSAKAVTSGSSLRQMTTATPQTTPPLHGTNPHGQGTVAVIDTNPDPTRPYGSDPQGQSNNEDIVVGRSRGEQRADGTYHGHITIAALFGNEILGVDTNPGESRAGPLDAVQQALLTPLCNGSGNQICLSAVTADSKTTSSGSTNHFSAAHVTLGGANGIDAGAAESDGNISSDGTCQTSTGSSQVANVNAGGQALATLAKSSTTSKACQGQAPQQTNTSQVISLGGTGVPIPDPGCANGTPDTVTGIPTLLPVICNADDSSPAQTGAGQVAGSQADAPYGVREALDVFLLATPTTQLAKLTTGASESRAVAPATTTTTTPPPSGGGGETGKPQCSDGIDNDGDGLIDAADPGCHTDGNANNPASYNANDNSEANSGGGVQGSTGGKNGKPQCSDGIDNDGDGLVDAADPGCHTDGNANNAASYNPKDTSEANGGGVEGASGNGAPQCSDGVDNDGDGLVDAADPGCHSDGNANNAASYSPNDNSEANGGGSLPFTGTDVLLLALIGLGTLGSGLGLRRVVRRRTDVA